VIVINQTMAKLYWPGRSALGQRVVCAEGDSGWNRTGELEIIGVARDTFLTSMDQTEPTIFQLPTYRSLPRVLATNRTAAEAAIVAARRIDPGLRIRVDSLMAAFAPRFRGTRVGAAIAGSLGLLALGFAGVGMFGVFTYWVRQRTQEIGVRMALGAQSSDVVGLVLGTTARAVLIGIAAGIAASVASARLLTAFLFGLSCVDPLTYAAVAAILVGASLLAAVLPAWRATRIDPLVALRYE
jgi:putative ABC transport system permease protein